MKRRTFLKCLPAGATVVAVASPVLAAQLGDPVDAREVWFICESCERPLYEGDSAFVYEDGPAFCEAHAPTWADLKNEQDEAIAAGDFGGWFEDDQRAHEARRYVLDKIDAGQGAVKVVHRL
jgi:hypothetical protein